MIEDEHSQSVEAAGFRIHKIEAQPAKAEKPELNLAQVEQDLFDFFSKVSGAIPEWVPIVPSFLKAKKEQWMASAALRNKNLATGEKLENKPEALKLFLEKTLSGLWEEGKTALDVLLIFGTGGSGNVVVGAERVAAKEVTAAAGKITLEGLTAKIGKLASGGEGAVFDLLPGFFKGLARKLERHPEQAKHLLALGNVFDRLQKIPGARKIMEELLAKQEWWQKVKAELQSSQNRTREAQRVFGAVNRSGFTLAAKPS